MAQRVLDPETGPSRAKPGKAKAAQGRTRYEDDLYTWVQEQVALLRAGRIDEVDLENVAEELSDVGSEQYSKLESALEVLLAHILKWDHQTQRRSCSWALTISEQRVRIELQLKKNPGLKSRISEALRDGFRLGRLRAAREMQNDIREMPVDCPYSWDDILNRPFEFDSVDR